MTPAEKYTEAIQNLAVQRWLAEMATDAHNNAKALEETTRMAWGQALNAVAANRAKTRPRGQNDAAKIRKFMQKTLSERERPKTAAWHSDPTIWRLSPCQLRRIRDRPSSLGQSPAFIQRCAKRSMPATTLDVRRSQLARAMIDCRK